MKISDKFLYILILIFVVLHLILHNYLPDSIVKYFWIPLWGLPLIIVIREIIKWLRKN